MDRGRAATEQALVNFSSWLDEVSPWHREHRIPVELAGDTPALVREVWRHIGWSAVLGPRPERELADRKAEKTILGWFSKAKYRESRNVTTPDEALRVMRAGLPAKSRFVTTSRWCSDVYVTDETSAGDDPPLLRLKKDGTLRSECSSWARWIIRGICATVGEGRPMSYGGPPISGEQPFAPLFPELYAIHDGVWILVGDQMDGKGRPRTAQPKRMLCRSSIEYFDFVMGLPDGTAEHFFSGPESDRYLAVHDARELDPRRPGVPGYRSVTDEHGMVDLDGVRFWVRKFPDGRSAELHVPRSQFAAARAVLRQREIEVYEQDHPDAREWVDADGTIIVEVTG